MSYNMRSMRLLCSALFVGFSFSVSFAKTERLKILVIESYFPPKTSTAALNQITQLVQDGHDVEIYARNKNLMTAPHADVEKYHLMNCVVSKPRAEDLAGYDIIFAMFGSRGKEIIDLLGSRKLPNTKIVTCIRGSDITKRLKQFSKKYYRTLFEEGHLFLPVCRYFEDKLLELGCSPDKIVVFPSTIDCNFFRYRKNVPIFGGPIKIVTVSRLTQKKGLEYSIKAIAQLSERYPEIEYTIAGGGNLEGELRSLIMSLGMQYTIKLVGHKSQEEVRRLLNESHIFVLPSITDKSGDQEGIPNALKEAMAVGLPVVSTFHAGIPELIYSGASGLLVPEKNIKKLVEKIEYLILNPAKWDSLCRAARRTIELRYDRHVMNARLTPLLCSLKRGAL